MGVCDARVLELCGDEVYKGSKYVKLRAASASLGDGRHKREERLSLVARWHCFHGRVKVLFLRHLTLQWFTITSTTLSVYFASSESLKV